MKIRILSFLFCLALVAGLGCSGRKKAVPVIGISLPTQREERWVRDANRLQEEATKRGFKTEIRISENNAVLQAQQCRELVDRHVDVLIIAPHDAKSAAELVNYAASKKVKVVAYDRLILDSLPDIYVGFDNERIGELQGQYLTFTVPAGNYLLMSGAPTDVNSAFLKKGAMKYISPLVESGAVKVVADKPVDDWNPEYAREIAEDALVATGGRIDAVLAPNDATAGAAITALAKYKLAGKAVVAGHDAELSAVWRILNGTQGMTVFIDTRELASAAMEASAELIAGRAPRSNAKLNNGSGEVNSFLLPPTLVTKANVDSVLIDSGYFKREAVYGEKLELEMESR